MRTTFVDASRVTEVVRGLTRQYAELNWAVAWATANPCMSSLLETPDKIKRLIVGTDFYQTDPAVLEALAPIAGVRAVPPGGGGTFHPKLYLFRDGERMAALVGSANFTAAAMSSNIEACVLIEGASAEPIFLELKAFVEQCWGSASALDDGFLRKYRLAYEATRALRALLGRGIRISQPRPDAEHSDLLSMTWDEYSTLILRTDSCEQRLRQLRLANQMLSKVDEFAALDLDERRAIAGTLSRLQDQRDGVNWSYFGSMGGFGGFQTLINQNSPALSAALDAIPLTGEVELADYARYVESFNRAFERSTRKGGVPTASRLLAIKRPDVFVCMDGENRRRLCADLGVAFSTVDLESYWTDIIEPIRCSRWWQAPRPRGPAGHIWDGRVAMLDAIYYDPS